MQKKERFFRFQSERKIEISKEEYERAWRGDPEDLIDALLMDCETHRDNA